MKKLILLWTVLPLMTIKVKSVDIRMDPGMREGEPSYIYCDVGTVTAGVTFYTEPGNVKGNCLAPGAACSSTLYTITQNTTGALLEIASVDVSREEGVWYCRHNTDRSRNTISLNDHTIAGFLLSRDWTEPSGPVDTFPAAMTLSCTNQVPNFNFIYEVNESNIGAVPPEAVRMTTQSLYNGTTCEDGNNFYVIMMRANNSLCAFNNKQRVKFSFTFYRNIVTAPFNVDFTENTFEKKCHSQEATSNYSHGGLIASVVVNVCLMAILVPVLVLLFRRKESGYCKRERREDQRDTNQTGTTEVSTTASNLYSDLDHINSVKQTYSEIMTAEYEAPRNSSSPYAN